MGSIELLGQQEKDGERETTAIVGWMTAWPLRMNWMIYDKKLVEEWRDRHAPMAHDVREHAEDQQKQAGLALLDWSHNQAHLDVQAFKPGANSLQRFFSLASGDEANSRE